MKIVIAAGGTGGHIIPALTIADELSQKNHEIEWFGLKTGLESKLVPAAGYEITFLPNFSGIRGKSIRSLVSSPLKLLRAVYCSIKNLRAIKPNGVITMGGYVSGPVGLAAFLLKIPLVVHEQNSVAGTTNKILAKLSKNVLSAYKHSFDRKTKFLYVGNPVRRELIDIEKYKPNNLYPEKINLLVIGGSLGARSVNNIVAEMMKDASMQRKINLVHQTGIKDFESINEKYKQIKKDNDVDITVTPYIDDMDKKYTWADLVISRAGAMSISEILACGLPSILIPFPYATDNHQYYNAKELADTKAAILIEQDALTVDKLKNVLEQNFADIKFLVSMSKNTEKLFNHGVNQKIADHCIQAFNYY